MAREAQLVWYDLAVESYRTVASRREQAWRVAGLWGVVIVAAEFLSGMVDTDPETADPLAVTGTALLLLLAYGVLAPTVMIGWYRFLLLGELPNGPAPPIGARTFRMLGYYVLISLVVGVPLGLALALLAAPLGEGALLPAMILGLVLILYVVARLSLVFPSIAVEEPHIGIGGAWALSTGSGLALFLGTLAVAVPISVVIGLFEATGLLGLRLLAAVLVVVQLLLFASFYALAFRELRANAQPPALPD